MPLRGTLLAGRQQLVEQRTGHAWPVVGDTLRLTMAPQQAYLFRVTARGDPSSPAPLPKHCPFTDRLTKDFRMVRFSYGTLRPLASVAVAGDFNASSPNTHFMQAENSSLQVWSALTPCARGATATTSSSRLAVDTQSIRPGAGARSVRWAQLRNRREVGGTCSRRRRVLITPSA